MGIVAIVILSVTMGWAAFTGGLEAISGTQSNGVPRYYLWFESGRALKRFYEYQPPERKSVVVDTSGMSYRTADGTQPTKRDRSKPYPRLDTDIQIDSGILPADIPQPAPFTQPVITQAPAPLYQGQIEQAPLPSSPASSRPSPPTLKSRVPERLSIGRQVQNALLADDSLSRSVQLSLNVISKGSKVTLKGIVLDKEEKDYVGAQAEKMAGAGNVDNKLTIL